MAAEPTALPGDAEQLDAFVAWINAMECCDHTLQGRGALREASVLCSVVRSVDADFFAQCSHGGLEALHEAVLSYYADELACDASRLPPIDVGRIAETKSQQGDAELAKVLRLLLGIVVKSAKNDRSIHAMQTLPYTEQMVLMRVTEAVLALIDGEARGDGAGTANASPAAPSPAPAGAQQELDLLRREVEKERALVNVQQEQFAHAEAEVERLMEENTEIAAALKSLRSTERERDSLQDQVDEWRHTVEQSRKQQVALDKYKLRAEEAGDLKRHIQDLEEQNRRLVEQTAAKDAQKHMSGTPDRAMKLAEQQYATLHRRHESLLAAKDDLEERYSKLEADRAADQSQLRELLERDRMPDDAHNVHSADVADALAPTAQADEGAGPLRAQVAQVEAEVERLRARLREVDAPETAQDADARAADSAAPETAQHADARVTDDEEAPTFAEYHSSLAAVHAEITAMRNNARCKEREAESLLRRLAKKYGGEKSSGKSMPREFKPVLNLLAESFQLDDVVMQRLQGCWNQANQRERDALRHEQRLMASAYQMLSHRIYRETSWESVQSSAAAPDCWPASSSGGGIRAATPDRAPNGPAPVPPAVMDADGTTAWSAFNMTWLAQQRNALAGALRISRG
ncbi:hypothetical protein MSPP1_002848 [Malassezia sp. CBS 17886]|nr:hypothetical protein MSPP1_002848 [Malassezia sp. CBS 17886]